jgi:hypothetical protein
MASQDHAHTASDLQVAISPTPGPWVAWRTTISAHVSRGGETGMHIASCDIGAGDWHDPDRSEGVANARLIAAAPELLEALKGLSVILTRAESNASGNPEWEIVSRRINAARAAISKAEGK